MEVVPPDSTTVSTERQALIFGLISVLLWSTVATGFKLGLTTMSVLQLLFMGTAVSWLVFLICAGWQRAFKIEPGDRLLVVVFGLINPCIYYLILFSAYDLLPAYIAQPLNYTWAITLSLLAIPLLKQRLTLRSILAICVSYFGVVILLTTGEAVDGAGLNPWGVVLALVSTLFWALYWILNTRSKSAPIALMFWSFTVALPILALATLSTDGMPKLSTDTLIYGLWVGLLEMGITFLTWQRALRLTAHVSRISQLIFFSPFLSLVLIYFVLGEPVGLGAVVGLLVIVLGVWLNRSNNPA